MADVTWADAVSAIGSFATPVVVAGLIYQLSRRQSRNEELLRTRMEYYKTLVPQLNDVMCYFTFIGGWRDLSPPEMIAIKRRLDRDFFCARPLFSEEVLETYVAFTGLCFSTFGAWGEDAKLRTSPGRRREAWQAVAEWETAWGSMFTKRFDEGVSPEELTAIRRSHDALLAAIVRDLDVTRAQSKYTTDRVSFNAHTPAPTPVEGSMGS